MKNNEKEVLNTKQQVLNRLGLDSESELSNENVFRRFISMDAVVDKDILGMILPKIENFSELVVKQQEFIAEMADKQKFIDEKALEGFNKTKEIISEVIKANPTMDTDLMIYLIDSLKEMDKYISDHVKGAGNRTDRLINIGIGVGTVVAGTVLAIVFKGGGGGGNPSK
ncbi:hypothetical protein [Planomicrobium sp. MB-3u-38]|uniref:hypothetical protein n=1 Tax=Planomicrobium sp. MB-3u-38 TaxID=2058318 RepID=UPI000C7BBB7C|nr:hypothetical protein [Planomicrobium sp. MB-3u-38]PKH08526.1 hypothetical protein CXF70_16600 [Planomicrobium sp. MB-3u-38]